MLAQAAGQPLFSVTLKQEVAAASLEGGAPRRYAFALRPNACDTFFKSDAYLLVQVQTNVLLRSSPRRSFVSDRLGQVRPTNLVDL